MIYQNSSQILPFKSIIKNINNFTFNTLLFEIVSLRWILNMSLKISKLYFKYKMNKIKKHQIYEFLKINSDN
jgi:hypothetical protein